MSLHQPITDFGFKKLFGDLERVELGEIKKGRKKSPSLSYLLISFNQSSRISSSSFFTIPACSNP